MDVSQHLKCFLNLMVNPEGILLFSIFADVMWNRTPDSIIKQAFCSFFANFNKYVFGLISKMLESLNLNEFIY